MVFRFLLIFLKIYYQKFVTIAYTYLLYDDMIIFNPSVKFTNVVANFTLDPGIIPVYAFSDIMYTLKYETILLELNLFSSINIKVFTRNPPLKRNRLHNGAFCSL